jgi:hypothetical protein
MNTRHPSTSRNFLTQTGISVFLSRIAAKLRDSLRVNVPSGYEDETGFHFDIKAAEESNSTFHFSI